MQDQCSKISYTSNKQKTQFLKDIAYFSDTDWDTKKDPEASLQRVPWAEFGII